MFTRQRIYKIGKMKVKTLNCAFRKPYRRDKIHGR